MKRWIYGVVAASVVTWSAHAGAQQSAAVVPPHPLAVDPSAPPLVMENPRSEPQREPVAPNLAISRLRQGCLITLSHPTVQTRLSFYVSNSAMNGTQGAAEKNDSVLVLWEPAPLEPAMSSLASASKQTGAITGGGASALTYRSFVISVDGRPYDIYKAGELAEPYRESGWRGWAVPLDDAVVSGLSAGQNIELFYPSVVEQNWTLSQALSHSIKTCKSQKVATRKDPIEAWPVPEDGSVVISPKMMRLGKPRGNPATWITSNDYPAAAMREDRRGTATIKLYVSPRGFLKRCEVVKSSGWLDLDRQTCSIVFRRARFWSTTDENGRMKEGTYQQSIVWLIS